MQSKSGLEQVFVPGVQTRHDRVLSVLCMSDDDEGRMTSWTDRLSADRRHVICCVSLLVLRPPSLCPLLGDPRILFSLRAHSFSLDRPETTYSLPTVQYSRRDAGTDSDSEHPVLHLKIDAGNSDSFLRPFFHGRWNGANKKGLFHSAS